MNFKAKYLLLGVFVVLGIAGCGIGSSIFGLTAKVYAVKFVPQAPGTPGVLKADTPNKGCKNNPHNGCILFEENTVGLMKLYLPGSRSRGKSCAEGAQRVITEVKLTTTGSGEKGDFTVLPDDWLKAEAFPKLDLSNGIVYEKDVDAASSQAWLLNTNAHDSSLAIRSFWYRVTATNCGATPDTWVSDPRGDNKGSWD